MKYSYPPSILYEDDCILVCRKPPGMATQSRRIGEATVESFLKNYLAQTSCSHQEPFLGIIHRLDQPVEGILVFARTPQAAAALNRQLQNGGFGKYYRAFALSAPPMAEGQLEDYLKKDAKTNLSFVSSPSDPGAKCARLSYKVISRPPYYFADALSLDSGAELEIHLDTGRHHQIRVQLAHLGCPILGDRKYSKDVTSGNRLFLCACRLEFLHPKTKKPMVFSLPFPQSST